MTSDAPVSAVLNSLAALATIWLAVAGAGIPLARRLPISSGNPSSGNPLAHIVWTAGLGLTVIAWVLALLGWGGLLHQTVIGVLTLAAAVWGVVELTRIAWQYRTFQPPHRELENPRNRLAVLPDVFTPHWVRHRELPSHCGADVAIVIVAAISTLAMLVGALAPVTSRETVAGTLEVAKEIALTQSFGSAPPGQLQFGHGLVSMGRWPSTARSPRG